MVALRLFGEYSSGWFEGRRKGFVIYPERMSGWEETAIGRDKEMKGKGGGEKTKVLQVKDWEGVLVMFILIEDCSTKS